ncbi:thiol-disulfide oxidoreductase-associated membrane protein CcdA2 [Amedibacillus sp. YH-ame6]
MYHEVYFGTVFVAGILSFFSPCIFPLLPVYMSTLFKDVDTHEKQTIMKIKHLRAIAKTLCFILGLSTVFFILGYGAGALSGVLNHPYTNYVMGAIVIVMGLHQMEIINIKTLQREKKVKMKQKEFKGYLQAYILGLTFSFGWTPCIGPVLSAVLAIAASNNGSALYGGSLMMVYTLGLSIPFLLLALASSFIMQYFQFIKKHMILIKRISGLLLVCMGVLLMFNKLNELITLF